MLISIKLIIKRLFCCDFSPEYLIYLGRSYHKSSGIKRMILYRKFLKVCMIRGIEMDGFDKIGDNLVLAHAFGITVHSDAIIGNNCTLFKGCTIGSVRSGRLKGVPIIGDRVVVGLNSTICGRITIGNDVFICANSFVDFDVPDNSIVVGNPGTIHHKECASKDYC